MERSSGLLLADRASGGIERLAEGRHDSAGGFVTAALVLRASLDQGDWPERLSYDSDQERRVNQARMRPVADQPLPKGKGFGLGTLAERARRARK